MKTIAVISIFISIVLIDSTPDTIMPEIQFAENSTQMIPLAGCDTSDAALFCLPLQQIASIAKTMAENPEIILEINGHIDSDETKYTSLSEERAESVKVELVKTGIASERLKTVGFGTTRIRIAGSEMQGLSENELAAAHQINRRVEFRVLSWDYGK